MARPKKTKPARGNGTAKAAATVLELRERIKQLEYDLKNYKAALRHFLPPKRFRFTRKELREMEVFRPTFSEFVDQFEARVKAGQ